MDILPRLQEIQERNGYLPQEELLALSRASGISREELVGTASFYSFLGFAPGEGKTHIENFYPCRRAGVLLTPARSGAWEALDKARREPETVLSLLEEAGLLGRSGGAFPVARKWRITAAESAERKIVVCNADEGEPGNGKDRALLEHNPEAVLEGMAVCGAAVGAKEGYLYLRGEYADLRPGLLEAISGAPLGEFRLELRMGSGAYICGEETALLSSLEGLRGEPRLKPPFPGTAGYRGCPTVVNNVETFACVPEILRRGAAAFRQIGDPAYPGPKLYTVFGCVRFPGVYEMPSGVTAGELLEAAGGLAEGEELKAVLCGGGSGTLLGPDCLDMVMTPGGCSARGAVFGTASLRFIGAGEELPEIVRELTGFFARESCGMCVPCRVGLHRLEKRLSELEQSGCDPEEREELRGLAEHIRASARCGLGQAAVTPLLSMLKNFPEVLTCV